MSKICFEYYLKLILRELRVELLFALVTTVLLVKLDQLNSVLNSSEYTDNAIKLLSYRNYLPLQYFGFTVILVVAGIFLVMRKANHIKNNTLCCGEITLSLFAIVIVLIWVGLLIIFINNPILRAILTVICLIVGSGYLIVEQK